MIVIGHAAKPGFGAEGQASQASPLPSLSVSVCCGLASCGQLSMPFGMPSPSRSFASGVVQESVLSSGQGSQASPSPSPSVSGCAPLSIGRIGLNTSGQLSELLGMPSPSLSVAVMLPSYSPGRIGTQLGSPGGAWPGQFSSW